MPKSIRWEDLQVPSWVHEEYHQNGHWRTSARHHSIVPTHHAVHHIISHLREWRSSWSEICGLGQVRREQSNRLVSQDLVSAADKEVQFYTITESLLYHSTWLAHSIRFAFFFGLVSYHINETHPWRTWRPFSHESLPHTAWPSQASLLHRSLNPLKCHFSDLLQRASPPWQLLHLKQLPSHALYLPVIKHPFL